MDESDKTLGQLAFEAYRAEVNGQTFDDKQIPAWDELHGNRGRVHRGWEAAAEAVRERTRTMDGIERALTDPSSRVRRGRPLKSHAQPLSDFLPAGVLAADESDPIRFEPLPPVGDDVVTQARESVPVEADDDTGDDAA